METGKCPLTWSRKMKKFFLGVDIGNTKSHALICDDQGRVMGFARAGCGNHEVIGYELFAELIQFLAGDALRSAGITTQQVSGAGFGIAGFDWPGQYEPLFRGIQGIGLNCPTKLVNDTLIGLVAGASRGWGIGLVAGTGSNCWGMDESGHIGRMTGLSHLMDEGGGAGSIVLWAIQAVGRAWTRRGPETTLTGLLLEHMGEIDIVNLLQRLGEQGAQIDAGLAPRVIECARRGDGVAQGIIHRAAESLASLCLGVSRQLDLLQKPVEVVLIGSVFKAGQVLIDPLTGHILQDIPQASLTRLEAPPVVGGVLLGMKEAGFSPGLDEVQHIKVSTTDLVESLDRED